MGNIDTKWLKSVTESRKNMPVAPTPTTKKGIAQKEAWETELEAAGVMNPGGAKRQPSGGLSSIQTPLGNVSTTPAQVQTVQQAGQTAIGAVSNLTARDNAKADQARANLIGSIEDENKKAEDKKRMVLQQSLDRTMSRLMKERRPGMASKNSTIKTGPMGIPTSMLQKRPTLLGS